MAIKPQGIHDNYMLLYGCCFRLDYGINSNPTDDLLTNERAKCDPGEWVSLACDNALKHIHLCSWIREAVDGKEKCSCLICRYIGCLIYARLFINTPFSSSNILLQLHIQHFFQTWFSDSLFHDGTCDEHLFHPPFSYYKNLFEMRADREEKRTGKRVGVGGWDNVWLLSDSVGHNR
jgi:hypothetical protein